jgi:hypothetical protein
VPPILVRRIVVLDPWPRGTSATTLRRERGNPPPAAPDGQHFARARRQARGTRHRDGRLSGDRIKNTRKSGQRPGTAQFELVDAASNTPAPRRDERRAPQFPRGPRWSRMGTVLAPCERSVGTPDSPVTMATKLGLNRSGTASGGTGVLDRLERSLALVHRPRPLLPM